VWGSWVGDYGLWIGDGRSWVGDGGSWGSNLQDVGNGFIWDILFIVLFILF